MFTAAKPSIEVVADKLLNKTLLSPQAQEMVNYGIENITIPVLSDIIYKNGDDKLFNEYLAKACSDFTKHNCSSSQMQPLNVSSFPLMATRCGIKYGINPCAGCGCFVSTTIANTIQIPETLLDKASSFLLATLLTVAPTIVEIGLNTVQVSGEVIGGLVIDIYGATLSFCFGVFFSIAASVWVDTLEEKFTRRVYGFKSANEAITASLKAKHLMTDTRSFLLFQNEKHWVSKAFVFLVSAAVLPLMICGVLVEIFVWKIGGLFPELYKFNEAVNGSFTTSNGVATSMTLSLVNLVSYVADDESTAELKFFMVLFGSVVVGFPLLRAAILLVIGCLPLKPMQHYTLSHASNVIGAFGALEPLFVCMILIMFELPPLTDQVVTTPECTKIEQQFPFNYLINTFGLYDTYCFVMWFQLLPLTAILLLGWICSVWLNSIAWSKTLDIYRPTGCPNDPGGPYCCCNKRSPCCTDCCER